MSLKASRIAALGATLAVVAAMSFATASASAAPLNCEEAKSTAPLCVNFKEFEALGTLGVKKLNQNIELEQGRFNGYLELLSLSPISGSVHGVVSAKSFEAPVKIFGSSSKIGVAFEQVGVANGSLNEIESAGNPNCEMNPSEVCVKLTVPTEINISFTSITVFGLKFAIKCKTATPISFPLADNLRLNEELLDFEVGAHFTGTVTFPKVTCGSEFFKFLNESLLTEQFSGPGNPYSLTIRE